MQFYENIKKPFLFCYRLFTYQHTHTHTPYWENVSIFTGTEWTKQENMTKQNSLLANVRSTIFLTDTWNSI